MYAAGVRLPWLKYDQKLEPNELLQKVSGIVGMGVRMKVTEWRSKATLSLKEGADIGSQTPDRAH